MTTNTKEMGVEEKIKELRQMFIDQEAFLGIQETAKIVICIKQLSDLIQTKDQATEKAVEDEKKLGWEGYVVVDPQANNYKCSPIFFSIKEAEKWRRDFGEPALKVETVDIILKTKHE